MHSPAKEDPICQSALLDETYAYYMEVKRTEKEKSWAFRSGEFSSLFRIGCFRQVKLPPLGLRAQQSPSSIHT
jgi:hypothetical protein